MWNYPNGDPVGHLRDTRNAKEANEEIKRRTFNQASASMKIIQNQVEQSINHIGDLKKQWEADDKKFKEDLAKLGINI